MAYLEGALDTFQHELAARFTGLRDARSQSPVYVLEHGLDTERLARVRDSVGAAVRRTGIGGWWRERSLPLLVVATEVGYGYRGTGTDFWPALGAALSAELSFTEHVRLSELFAAAHERFGLKRPADTPWNRAFNRIAWPISNAIAPLEVHRSLAQALHQVFQAPPASLDDADLSAALQVAARAVGSPRLQDWVADTGLALALARRLMGLEQADEIAPEAVERIWQDLSADSAARRAMRQALRGRRAAGRAMRSAAAAAEPARLQLCGCASATPSLVLTGAFTEPSAAHRRALRGLRHSPWRGADPIGLEAFYGGHPQGLALKTLPGRGEEFLAGLEDIVADADLRARLVGAGPDLTLPLVFSGAGDVALQARDRTVPLEGEAWVLLREEGALPPGVLAVGRVGDAVCLHVPSPADARTWLSGIGVSIRDAAAVEAVHAATIGRTPRGPAFGRGMPGLFRLTGPGGNAVIGGDDAGGVELNADAPYLLVTAAAGEHQLPVSLSGRESRLTWTSGSSDDAPEPPLDVSLDPSGASLDMLRRGEVAIHLRTAVRLPVVPIDLSVVIGDRVVAKGRSSPVRLPTVLTASDGVFEELLQQLDRAELPRAGDMWLVADLGGLSREWWPLTREVRRVAWERHDQQWTPRSEGAALGIGIIDSEQPLATVRPASPEDADAIRLLLPLENGQAIDEAGFVVGPRKLNFAADIAPPGRIGRGWRSGADVAAAEVCLNYLRWSWAEARNPVLEIGRRRVAAYLEAVTVVQFCGGAWAQSETRYAQAPPERWAALAEAAIREGLTDGADLPQLRGDWKIGAYTRLLAQRMCDLAPGVWAAAGITEALAERLDMAVSDAWEDLFREILHREGRFILEEPDPGNSAAAWAGAVKAADDRMRLSDLAASILPSSRARTLVSADYQDLAREEVSDILVAAHVDLSPRGQPTWLSDSDLRVALLFWARPAALSASPEWRRSLERLLSDRQTARAVRYAALRYRASRGGCA